MPIPTITVTGTVLPPSNVSTGGSVLFELSASVVDPGAGVVVPRTVSTPILTGGAISVALWPNELGLIQTRYAVYVVMPPGAPGLDEEKTLIGYAVFPASPATQDLGDMISQSTSGVLVGPIIYPTLADAVAAAVAAASTATTQAGTATTQAGIAATQAGNAANSATQAQNFATAAAAVGSTYPSVAAGIAAVANGAVFFVPIAGGIGLTVYQRSGASANVIGSVQGDTFDTRAAYTAWVAAGGVAVNGRAYLVGGLQFVGSTGATAIPDLPGLVPNGISTPLHFGAIGDGVADDTAAMQSLFLFADDIFITAGQYRVTAPLTHIGGPFKVDGEGFGASKIVCDDCSGLEINLNNNDAPDKKSTCSLTQFSIVARNNSGGRRGLFIRGGNTDLSEEGNKGPNVNIQITGENSDTAFTIGAYLLNCGYADLSGITVVGARNDYSLMEYGIALAGGNDITAFGHSIFWADVGVVIGYPGSGSTFFTVEGTSWVAGHVVGVRRGYEILTAPPGDHHSVIGGHVNAMEAALYCEPTPGNVAAQCVFEDVNVLKMTPRLNMPTPKVDETGTVRASTSLSVQLAVAAPSVDLSGRVIYISSGAGAGQYRKITTYDTDTKVATIDAAWGTAPDTTSVYWIEWAFHGIRGFRFQRLKVTSCDISRGSDSPYDTSIDLLDGCSNCFVVGNVLDIGICSIANVNTQITRGTAPVPHTIYGNKSSLGIHIDQNMTSTAPSGATPTINAVDFGTGTNKVTLAARGYGPTVDVDILPKGAGRVVMGGPALLRTYTVATRPLASSAGPGALIFVSDAAPGAQYQGATSTGWVPLG